jgi:ribosomal-protein-alanine N-acetyltransferase
MASRLESIEIRPWQRGDEEVLPRVANNRAIWRNISNRFPYPYGRQEALDWIAIANREPENAQHFAIEMKGAVVGGVGFEREQDLSTLTAEIGYWIGEPFWGRGIATLALTSATQLAFRDFDFVRLQAGVLEWNPASCRVLEKVGYSLEGRLRSHVYKDGETCDQFVYGLLRADHIQILQAGDERR